MKEVIAIISETVHSRARVILDEHGHIVEVDEIIEEKERFDLELQEIEDELEDDEPIEDPREVEE